MAVRKSVSFREETEMSVFFFNQPPNIVLERFSDKLREEALKSTNISKVCPAYSDFYSIGESDSESEIEHAVPEVIEFINMSEVSGLNSHFLLFFDCPGVPVADILSALTHFFVHDEIETYTVVRPIKKTDAGTDFKIGYEGLIIGITMKSDKNCKKYVTSEKELIISDSLEAKLIPGARGEDIWNTHMLEKNFLQGFFFVGSDPVDLSPENLCYLASIPKSYTKDFVKKEIYSHANEYPLHVISNPLEGRCVVRLEFERQETVRFLVKRCMSFDGKPVIVLPCVDRRPIEELLQKYQVCVSGYSNAINPKEFIRILSNSYGPLAELNINYEGLETLAVFQTVSAAEACVRKKEIFVKNHKIRFAAVSRAYRLTGLKYHKGKYNYLPPQRPLPIIPALYTYQPPEKSQVKPT